jgi:hypothetical protein
MKTNGKVATIVAAIAALAVSGIALADQNPGRSKDKGKGTGPGSKISLDVENHCEPLDPMDEDVDFDKPMLKVTSTIRNDSDVAIPVPVVVAEKQVDGLQLLRHSDPPKKKYWDEVGPRDTSLVADNPYEPLEPGASRDYFSYINLCGDRPLQQNAIGLNAEIKVMLKDVGGNILRSFIGNCDDVDTDGDGDKFNDGDQSRIDFDDPKYEWLNYWLGCF